MSSISFASSSILGNINSSGSIAPFQNTILTSCSSFLETLCDYLYDDLRPRILHEQRLQTLCDVCTVLQALMVLDVQAPSPDSSSLSSPPSGSISGTPSDSDDEDADMLTVDFGKQKDRPYALRTLRIGHLLQLILQDAQTRLVFRTQGILQAEVRWYVPKADDLNYPGKLLGLGNAHVLMGNLLR
jgi:hypothetical protein